MKYRSRHHSTLSPVADEGFTLLEVLVALTLFSFILIMLYGSLYSTGRSWQASEVQAQGNDDKRLILSFIRRQIEQVAPVLQVDEKENRLLFKGDQAALQFVSNLPAHHAGGGLHFLNLVLIRNELVLKYLPLTRDKAMFERDIFIDAKEASLLKDIEMIDITYFGRDEPDTEPNWRTVWDNPTRLPELIRLQIIEDDRNKWPELIIAPRAQIVKGQPQFVLYTEEENTDV